MKILIVDDDQLSLELLEHALQSMGHDVVTAQNGREAYETLGREQIRLVISDWEMPKVDGIELCQMIRSGDFGGYVYFVMLTSHSNRERMVEGLSAGADDFLAKPFDPAELEVRIRVGMRITGLETRDLAIFSLARLAESRDPETGEHLERVRSYCRALAARLRDKGAFGGAIDDAFVRLIYLTSPLHDIGKVAIPDFVLLKPGQLSSEEFEIMKTHTTFGAETLEDALRQYPEVAFLKMARDIAKYHHERIDGKGYPTGIAGDDIPLAARITTVADVYDALTSRRVYKSAFSHDVARSILLEGSGTQFDERVIEAYCDIEQEFQEIRARLQGDAQPEEAINA